MRCRGNRTYFADQAEVYGDRQLLVLNLKPRALNCKVFFIMVLPVMHETETSSLCVHE